MEGSIFGVVIVVLLLVILLFLLQRGHTSCDPACSLVFWFGYFGYPT
jgi:hypothetical protein